MPKNLLLTLQEKLRLSRQKKHNQNQENPPQNNSKRSINLLNSTYGEEFETYQQFQFQSNNYLKTAAITIQFAFLLVVIFNVLADNQIKKIDKQISDLANIISQDKQTESKLVRILTLIDQHKKIKSSLQPIYPKVESILSRTTPEIEILSLKVTPEEAKIATQANNVISYAYLIEQYYASQEIKQITITSATKNRRTQGFEVALKLEFK